MDTHKPSIIDLSGHTVIVTGAREPSDVARAAVWLASDDSDYVHGASLYVDGGMMLYPGFAGGG